MFCFGLWMTPSTAILKESLKLETELMWPNFTSSPVIDIKKRKCLRTWIHVVMSKILILSWYIKQSLSVSVLCYMIIKSLDWDLRMRVIHDIIACYSEIYFSQDLRVIRLYLNLPLFQVKELIATITEFARENYGATIMIMSYDNDSLIFNMHIMLKIISWYYHSIITQISIKYQNINYRPNNILSRYFDKPQYCTLVKDKVCGS